MVIAEISDYLSAPYLASITPVLMGWAARILGVLVLLAVTFLVASYVRRLIFSGLTRTKFDPTLTKFFSQLGRWAVLVFGMLICLNLFGMKTTSAAAVIAAAGLAIGLAFQGTLSNFAAGVMLLAFRPFKVGDYIVTHGEHVIVHEIELFYTLVDTFDNRRLILPNASLSNSEIQNVNFHPVRRADVAVGVDYAADIDQTRVALTTAAQGVEGQHREEGKGPGVVLQGLGGSSVDWQVRCWVKAGDFLTVKQAMVRAIKLQLDEAGIAIPFPQMDVHLDRRISVRPTTSDPENRDDA